MPNPKRRWSSTRRDKRRTHDKLDPMYLAICPVTGQRHLPHRAFWQGEKLYYRGRLVLEGKITKTAI